AVRRSGPRGAGSTWRRSLRARVRLRVRTGQRRTHGIGESGRRCCSRRDGMTQERTPDHELSLVGDGAETSPWDLARQRLADPEDSRTSWLATTRPDGRPHLMPVIAFWIDGAMHMVLGE